MRKRVGVIIMAVGLLLFFSVEMLVAEEASPDPTAEQTQAIVELLKEKKLITEEEAAAFIERLKRKIEREKPEGTTPPVGDENREISPEKTIIELQEDIERSNDAMMNEHRLLERRVDDMETGTIDALKNSAIKSDWAQRIKLKGDIRLRYQSDMFAEGNAQLVSPSDPGENLDNLINTTEDRQRFRYRARLGVKAKLMDYREANVGKVTVGFRMTTGNESDPVSTNETMGDYFKRDSFVFDRAYLKYTFKPTDLVWGRMPRFSMVGGRFANPWFSTDLVWDKDINFEGAAISYTTDTEQLKPLNVFATAGIFPLHEEETSSRDKWLWGAQLGFKVKPRFDTTFTLGAAYYDFQNIEGVQNELGHPDLNDFTAPQFLQKGNSYMDIDPTTGVKSALATDYNILDVYLRMNFGFFYPVQIVVDGQYVNNFGFDIERVKEVTGKEDPLENTDGYMVGLTIGYPVIADFGEWNISARYKHLGADAVLDAFTDSDFHLGGTNAEGWIASCAFGLYHNTWLAAKWISSDEIEDHKFGVDTFQLDFNARF